MAARIPLITVTAVRIEVSPLPPFASEVPVTKRVASRMMSISRVCVPTSVVVM